MKSTLISRARFVVVGFLLSIINLPLSTLFAQGTAFTYQGRLAASGGAANGLYDLQFSIYSSDTGPTIIAGPLATNSVALSNGLFTVALDFGTGVFPGADRWLEIAARTNGPGTFATLTPRQKLTATPYAITAGTVTGVVPSSSLTGTYSGAVNFNNAGNNFIGNGSGLTGVNALTLGGFGSTAFWQLSGNNVLPGQFLGSTNDQPVELRANGIRALRLEPNSTAGPNVIGGAPVNVVA